MNVARSHGRWLIALPLLLMGCAGGEHFVQRIDSRSRTFVARASDGQLDALRDETRTNDPSPPSEPPRNSWGSDDCDDDEGFVTQLVGGAALLVLSSPFTVPISVIGDEYDHEGTFPAFPYEVGDAAMFVGGDREGSGRTWMGNLQLVSASTWDGVGW